MKIIKRIFLVIITLVVIVAVIALLLPSHSHIEKSLVIKAPRENVFSLVNNFKSWNRWSPWYKMDTAMQMTWGGPEEGTDSWYTWESKNDQLGTGKITILHSSPTLDSIVTKMQFGGMEEHPARGCYVFKPVDGGVEMRMMMGVDYGYNLIGRIFGAIFKGSIEEDFTKSLENIRKVSEDGMAAAAAGNYAIVESWQNEQPYYGFRDTTSIATIGQKFLVNLARIERAMKETGVNMAGPVFAIYHRIDSSGMDVEWGIPTNKAGAGSGDIKSATLKSGKILKADYYGEYEKTEPAYDALKQYAQARHIQLDSTTREIYITDATTEKDPRRWLMYIVKESK
jgi:effector-binding domain-containing protein